MQTLDAPKTQMKELDFRPKNFGQVIGQKDAKDVLKVQIAAFKKTRNSVPHTLFLGYSGLGKTTLANVMAIEMGVSFHQVMATRIKTAMDLYNIIKNIEENDVVFIDEIHALAPKIQEHLYGLMEDFTWTMEDKNLNRQVLQRVPRFTLIGATTHTGDLNAPLLSRFQSKRYLKPYSIDDLTEMIMTASERIYNVSMPEEVATTIAQLSRRTARIAYNLLRSYMDVAEAATPGKVTPNVLTKKLLYATLKYENIDPIIGLDYPSRRYLKELAKENGPLGEDTIARMINEQNSTVRSMIEPFLLSEITLKYTQIGTGEIEETGSFISITKKGRVANQIAITYLKLCQKLQDQDWFKNECLSFKPE